ncbi:M42 family metallopeptidase [Ferroacidibacillus organovorans]|uniref:Endoglucanase n=1 Tax=Ferroacidibacillus organovorans TaxID=1765683 RepID=A0A1V4EPW3_9BACL|nr:M20/M25/M40 family metallo-hydrolase [Ferroacidibacillus organovorans]OPG14959.1 endoglucanase [Ferroacidibacillus organovorans]
MEKLELNLFKLLSLSGPCGFEHEVARAIYEHATLFADECRIDGLGNVWVGVRGAKDGPTLLVAAHMDEVGFMVKTIDANGFLRLEQLGGHDPRTVLGQDVVVLTEHGQVPGVVGTLSVHFLRYDDPARAPKFHELYVDCGATSREHAHAMGIRVGQAVAYEPSVRRIGETRIASKSLDDRAGCAVLLTALEAIDRAQLHGTVWGLFSVQEEVGLRGAKAAAAALRADVALAVDTTAVSDTPYPHAPVDHGLALGQGAAIKAMDFSLIGSLSVRRLLERVARERAIPVQTEVFAGIGTDAGALHMEGGAVPSGVISIPSRYTHSPIEMIDLNDLNGCYRLLRGFMETMSSVEEFSFLHT